MSPPVSVVVVSRGRPEALMRCLLGLSQLDYEHVEVVVVPCPAGAAALEESGFSPVTKRVVTDRANISAARNLGIAQAAGEIVAFIDDDAVAEPLWLRHLVALFEWSEVAAAGGYVLGRNGISLQWGARQVDGTGTATPLALTGRTPRILHPEAGHAIKTEGTNMALRRSDLVGLGGFDPAFRFYLDETDLNMRLAGAGRATAIVPLAQVHHRYLESPRRRADRSPTDLFEIAASSRIFLRKHAPETCPRSAFRTIRDAQRARLLRAMQDGRLGPDDVLRVLAGLGRGWREGAERPLGALCAIGPPAEAFRRFPTRPGAPRRLLAGRMRDRAALRMRAADLVRDGAIVTLLLLARDARYHRVRFAPGGFWEQAGGQFGRSRRDAPLLQLWRQNARIAAEVDRIVSIRGAFGDYE